MAGEGKRGLGAVTDLGSSPGSLLYFMRYRKELHSICGRRRWGHVLRNVSEVTSL